VHFAKHLIAKHDAERHEDNTKHDAERTEDGISESKKVTREWLMFAAIVIYAGLTAVQAYLTRNIAKSSQDQVNIAQTANRPYIGLNTTYTNYFEDKGGSIIRSGVPFNDTTGMQFSPEIKNFGPIPGTDFHSDWKIFLNGIEQVGEPRITDRPMMFFPGQTIRYEARVNGAQWQDIKNGNQTLTYQIMIVYDGPTGHSESCTKQRYEPQVGSFMLLGPC